MTKFLCSILMLFALSVPAQKSGHAVFQSNNSHTGVYPDPGGKFGQLLWTFKTNGKIFGSPVIWNHTAFIGSTDKLLYAIDISNHQQRWTFATGGAICSTPALSKGILYFGSYDGSFYAVNAENGKAIWTFKTEGEKKVGRKGLWGMQPLEEYMDDPFDFFLSSAVIDDNANVLYFGSGDGNIYALRCSDGSLLWKFKTNGIVHTSPALANGTIYAGSWDQYFYALDATTGTEQWKFKTGADSATHLLEGIQSSATVYEGMVYFGSRDGFFYGLEAKTGKMNWKYSANNSWILTTAAASDGILYLGTSDTYHFLALDAKTGKEKYLAEADGYEYSSPTIAGHTAYFGDFTGQLFAIDISSGAKIISRFKTTGRLQHAESILNKDKIDFNLLAKGLDLALYSSTVQGMDKLYQLGPILSSAVIADGIIYFASTDGNLYSIRLDRY